jgi:ABC-type antimicrobial peptide transport system permease subunit
VAGRADVHNGRKSQPVGWGLTNWVSPDKLGGSVEVLLAPDASDVEDILKRRLQAVGLPSDQVYTRVINSKQHIQSTLGLLRVVFFAMAALVLLIGVAGILNVGLATVGERVEEFALRRAVGTPRLLLAGIVLAETLLTGLFTAAAAAAIGVGAVALRFIGPLLANREPVLAHMVFPWSAGVAGVVAGLVAGLLGGLVPAIRAARIPIAAVMRA